MGGSPSGRGTGKAGGVGSSGGDASSRGRGPAGRVPRSGPAVTSIQTGDGNSLPVRVLILGAVLLFAFFILFPTLMAYLSQQAQYDAVRNELAQAQATSTALEEELARWKDDAYVRTQARDRLSYVMPGETTYVVIGAEQFAEQDAAASGGSAGQTTKPWFTTLSESAAVAGATGDVEPEESQRGWTDRLPSVPTPTATDAPSQDATSSSPGADGAKAATDDSDSTQTGE